MTTAKSPVGLLRAQAKKAAAYLKAMARGETFVHDQAGKIAGARKRDGITFAVAMDDKIIKIEMLWTFIVAKSEDEITDYILAQMQKEPMQ